ncbi:MAG TPA: TolC family protein [Candidatus Eisenbacteria bacterium]|jgi:outer membrane protein
MRLSERLRTVSLVALLAFAPAGAHGQEADTSGVAPAETSLPPPAAERVGADTLVAAGGRAGAERWTLARCVTTALESGGDSRTARARAAQAHGAALSAWRGLLPSVSGDLAYSQSRPDKQSGFRGILQDTTQPGDPTYNILLGRADYYSARGSVDMNLLSLPALAEKRRADLLRGGAQQGEAETRNTVAYQVKQQYFELLKAVRLAEVSRESEKLARDEEARSEALLQVGTVARGDVLKARARRAQTQLDRIRAENQVEVQRSRLKQVMGISPATPLDIEEILDENVVLPDSLDSIRRALRSRPGLSQSLAAERAARAGLFGARSERLPRVTGSLTVDRTRIKERYDLERLDPLSSMLPEAESDRYATQWAGTVALSIPFFDGLALEGNMKSAKGRLLEAEAARRQRELDVAVEVQQAWLALREAEQRIGVAKEGLASAQEDYRFSKGRYDLGAGTFLDLLTAEVNLSEAKRAYVEALADARVAEADLERAVGEKRY